MTAYRRRYLGNVTSTLKLDCSGGCASLQILNAINCILKVSNFYSMKLNHNLKNNLDMAVHTCKTNTGGW